MWDIRKGEAFPTVIRHVFSLMEDGETRTRPEIMDFIWENIEVEFSPNSLPTLLSNLVRDGYLNVREKPRKYKPNYYTMSEKGIKWWEEHQREDWGYGQAWEPEVCENKELEYWKQRRRGEGTPPVGMISDKLAEAKSGKLRIKASKFSGDEGDDIVRQVIDLMATGQVNVILESADGLS